MACQQIPYPDHVIETIARCFWPDILENDRTLRKDRIIGEHILYLQMATQLSTEGTKEPIFRKK